MVYKNLIVLLKKLCIFKRNIKESCLVIKYCINTPSIISPNRMNKILENKKVKIA